MRKFKVVISDSERVVVCILADYMNTDGPFIIFFNDDQIESPHAVFAKFDYACEEVEE